MTARDDLAAAVEREGALPMPVGNVRLTVERETEIRALRRLADLMDGDDARTGKVGIPVSYGHYLVWLAVVGSYGAWEAEWVRLTRTASVEAASEWSARQETQVQRLIELVYPGGATARARSAAEVRALAEVAS
ncbi:hypothetical protein [Streptomyces sp. NBC_01530]|uniref:hypothetical protein n=1 Tax=Streptomyces sp. NBC_01530 TaxID=2903895 RepID=UPI003869338A